MKGNDEFRMTNDELKIPGAVDKEAARLNDAFQKTLGAGIFSPFALRHSSFRLPCLT
jgi:hypothetical protein